MCPGKEIFKVLATTVEGKANESGKDGTGEDTGGR
jgi:hypothetical protein